MKMMKRSIAAIVFTSLAAAASAFASPETKKVVAGPQYARNGLHKMLFGKDYRALWTTPAAFEVLDLGREAGGLTPVARLAGMQTKVLALKGKDGRNYTFRSLDKKASELLEDDLRGTIVDRILEDALAAQHPASEVVARGLLEAAGIPTPPWRLVVLPDDPALGEFRKEFAGQVGDFADYPSAVTESNPGFLGVTEVIDHIEMYRRLQAGTGDQVDVQALLKARLMDIFMGDWDRHRKQWRWARFPSSPLWEPIPEDRDQAFSRYEGLLLDLNRSRDRRLQKLGPRYAGIGGLTENGRDQDRRLLSGLTREDYRRAATALRAQLTNDAIDGAVARMPAEWLSIDGARLAKDLKARRDALVEVADRFYEHLAERADVYLTDLPELVEAKRLEHGDVEVSVRPLPADGPPGEVTYRRVFNKQETEEIRLYALGGDDRITVTGREDGIKLRVIGGPGNDTLDDSQGGATRMSDSQGQNRVLSGPGTRNDTRPYEPPPPPENAPWLPPKDFDSATWRLPWIGYTSDIGFFLGQGLEHRRYGFRKDNFSSRHVFRAGYAFGETSGRFDYSGTFNRENSRNSLGLGFYWSGIEVLRFYGFGNETPNNGDKDFYRARENQVVLYPSFTWSITRTASLTMGPVGRYSRPRGSDPSFVDEAVPAYYGRSDFGQAGAHALFLLDGRDSNAYPRRGGLVAVRGTVWPKVWDTDSTYGEVNGNVNGYLSAGQWLTLAVRGGGQKVFGDYPYFDAASLGGGGLEKGPLDAPDETLRGFRAGRFTGDSSVYGNAELRLRLGRATIFVPTHFGIFGLFDGGRVWYQGEDSDEWHKSYGGGIWLSFLKYRSTFTAYYAHSKEDNLFRVGGGFTF
jgi:hypothetical protein